MLLSEMSVLERETSRERALDGILLSRVFGSKATTRGLEVETVLDRPIANDAGYEGPPGLYEVFCRGFGEPLAGRF